MQWSQTADPGRSTELSGTDAKSPRFRKVDFLGAITNDATRYAAPYGARRRIQGTGIEIGFDSGYSRNDSTNTIEAPFYAQGERELWKVALVRGAHHDHLVGILRSVDVLLTHVVRPVGYLSDLPAGFVIVHKCAIQVT